MTLTEDHDGCSMENCPIQNSVIKHCSLTKDECQYYTPKYSIQYIVELLRFIEDRLLQETINEKNQNWNL